MFNLRQQLPPLDLLVSFEAAARRESFTRAAHELNVTQSAVSQQIRALERHLGATLFERSHKAVRLTPEGVAFQQSVSAALAHLAAASRQAARAAATRLTVAADQSIIAMWLLPRLQRLREALPDVSLRIVASDRREDSFAETVDLAIVHGEGDWPGHAADPFFAEEVFPVCAPAYLAANPGVARLEGLAGAGLLDLEYENWNWMNWSIWFTECGADPPAPERRFVINNYPMLVQAARDGHGLALGWRRLVDDDLIAGRLVRPMDTVVSTRSAYWLVWRYRDEMPSPVKALRNWLVRERDAQRLHGIE